MAKQVINIGTRPNSKDGDAIRDAFNKVNSNFNELYALTSGTVDGLTELAQDYAAGMFTSGTHTGITVDYNDINNKLNLSLAPHISADLTGSVYSNNSTLLVDAVNASIPYSVISGAPTLSTVATTGSFSDLTNKPTTLAGYGITDSPTAGTNLGHLEVTDRITATGSVITFIKEPNTSTSDPIDTGLELSRPVGIGAGLINIAVESTWNTETSPAGTEWNWDGWANLDDVKLRTYASLRQTLRHRIGENIVGAELIMHDIANDKYYKIKFTSWAQGPAHTGAFAYTRQLIDTTIVVGVNFADGSALVKAPKEFVDLPQIFSGDTNEYILGLGDRGKHVYAFTESIIKIPTDAQVDFPIGSTIFIVTGVFAANKTVKVSCTSPTVIEREGSVGATLWNLKPYSTAMLIKVAENKWNLSGSISVPSDISDLNDTQGLLGIARNIESENDVSIRVNLTDSTTRTWRFGEDGNTEFPGNITAQGFIGTSTENLRVESGKISLNSSKSDSLYTDAGGTYTSASWSGNNIDFTGVEDIYLETLLERFDSHFAGSGSPWAAGYSNITVLINGNQTLTVTGASFSGGTNWRVEVAETPASDPTAITTAEFFYDFVSTLELDRDNNSYAIALDDSNFRINTRRDIRLESGDDIYIDGRSNMRLRNLSRTSGITIETDWNNEAYEWQFGEDGTLTTPGDITVAGHITGTSSASTLVLAAEPNSNTYIQLNDAVDSTINTVADLEIRTDVAGTAKTWTFGTDGSLEIPGDIRSESAINIDINLSDSTLRRWTFGEDGNLTAPGDITVAGGQIFGYVENDRFAVDGDTYQVRIGAGAGATTQGADAVAIGEGSGNYQQGTRSIAIGRGSGNSDQGISAVGIGFCAGGAQQGDYAIAIGFKAGRGPMAGDPDPAQPNNSIIINASGDKLNGTDSGLYIDPVREDTGNTAKSVYYNTTTKELTYANPTGGSGDSLLSDNNDITVEIDNAGTPGNTLTWTFGTDGNLTLPRGDIVSSDDISLIINSVDSTSYRWKFNQLGFVEIPNVNNQLGGTIGDTFANGGITIAASEAAGSYVELTNGDQTAGIYVQGDSTTTGANDVQVAIYTNNSGGMEFTGDGNAQLLGDLNLNNGVIKSVKGIDERTTGSFSAGVLTINNNQRNGDVRNFNTSGGFPFPPLFTANFTVNLTGFTLQQDHFTTVRVEIEQHSSAGYYPSVLQIDGVAQTINWEGGVNPAPIGGTRDLAVFYIRNTSATIIPAYSVIGHYIGGNQTRFDGDVTGSVFADDSTLLVDGVSGVLRANVNVPNTWTVTTGDKTWSFIYGDIGEGTTPTLEFPGNLQAAGSQTALFARTGDLSSNWGMSIDAGNSPYYVDIGELSGSNYWRFSGDGSLTLPGDIHGAPVISGGAFPSQVGRTVNITPADDASDKSFKFRIDQYGETFTRAYLEFPTAEVDKQVAAVFPHANGKAGFIYTQGNDTNGQGMNDAFNIFYNNGDIKITSMGSSGGLYTWKFGDSGDLTLPGNIQSEGSINIDINLSDSTLRRWRFGEDGDLAFPDATVQTTAFTGNAATIDILNTNGIDTNYSITFVENRDGAEILRADVDLTFNSWSNTLTAGNVAIKQTLTGGTDDGSDLIITSQPNPDRNNASNIGIYPGGATGTASQSGFVLIQGGNSDVVGLAGGNVIMRGGAHTNGGVGGTIKVESVLKIDDGVHEKFQTKADATGTVTHDCSAGHIFFHTTPSANWTANFTNLNLESGYATTVTLVIEQGGTGYYPNAVQIGGNGVGILWQGNTTPTPSSSRIDVVTFSILYDGLYTVLGQLTGF